MSNSELDSWWCSGLRTLFSQERKKAVVGLTPICVRVTLLLHSILKQLALSISSPISYILLSVIHSPPTFHNFILYFFHFYLTFCCLLWMPFLNTQTSFLLVSLVEVIKSTCPDVMTLDCVVSLIGINSTTYLTCLAHRKHNPAALTLKLLITWVGPLSGSERRGGATESLSFPSGCHHCDIFQIYPPLFLTSHDWLWIIKQSSATEQHRMHLSYVSM